MTAASGYVRVIDPGESYFPAEEPVAVELELARIHGITEDDELGNKQAEAFVRTFGLLEQIPAPKASELVTSIRRHAYDVRQVMSLCADLQLVEQGDPWGLQQLREWATEHPGEARAGSDPVKKTLVASAQRRITQAVSKWTGRVGYALEPGDSPATFTRVPRPSTLLGYIWDTYADWIAIGHAVRTCFNRECNAPFRVTDERRQFCRDQCRERERYLTREHGPRKGRRPHARQRRSVR